MGRQCGAVSLGRRCAHQAGQAATEYILIIGLVAIPIIAAYNGMQQTIKSFVRAIARMLYGPGI